MICDPFGSSGMESWARCIGGMNLASLVSMLWFVPRSTIKWNSAKVVSFATLLLAYPIYLSDPGPCRPGKCVWVSIVSALF